MEKVKVSKELAEVLDLVLEAHGDHKSFIIQQCAYSNWSAVSDFCELNAFGDNNKLDLIINAIYNGYEVLEDSKETDKNSIEIELDEYNKLLDAEEDLEFYKDIFKEYKNGKLSVGQFLDKIHHIIQNSEDI